MQLTYIGLRRRARSCTPYAILSMAPDIGQPYPPSVQNIPPPDVLIPEDGDDDELDLPIENEPDTGISRPDRPEKQPGGAPRDPEIKRRKDNIDDEDPAQPEKQRKPDVDEQLPEPETDRKPDAALH